MKKIELGDKVVCSKVPCVPMANGKRAIVIKKTRFTDTVQVLDLQFSRPYTTEDGRTGNVWKAFSNDCTVIESAYSMQVKAFKKAGGVMAVCADCGKEFVPAEGIEVAGATICPECAENYTECNECHEYHKTADMIETCEGLFICSTCIGLEELETCMVCGRPIWNGMDSDDFGNYVGNNHRYQVSCCEDCGRFVLDSELRRFDDGLCAECRRTAVPRNAIQSYSYKPDPDFGYLEGENTRQGYGLELEVELNRHTDLIGRLDRKTAWAIQQEQDKTYCKSDGSLSTGGFEIVTHPCSLAYHKERFGWENITDIAKKAGFCSNDSDNCGLHVHASRTLFGDGTQEQELTTAKVIILVNQFFDNELLNFSRRDMSELEHWARKNVASFVASDDQRSIHSKLESQRDCGRYYSVNLQNRHTIEFRLFKGTLNQETILATIQMVDRLIQYAKGHTVAETIDTTWEQLTDIDSLEQYKELSNYLERKGL